MISFFFLVFSDAIVQHLLPQFLKCTHYFFPAFDFIQLKCIYLMSAILIDIKHKFDNVTLLLEPDHYCRFPARKILGFLTWHKRLFMACLHVHFFTFMLDHQEMIDGREGGRVYFIASLPFFMLLFFFFFEELIFFKIFF